MTAGDTPFVSVILPIRNEEPYIEACLVRLLDQDYPSERFEVLVVDGMSTDATREIVERLQGDYGNDRLRLLDNPGRIVPTALNIGIRAAAGEVIVRMDGHTVPAPDYVTACVRALQESGAANAGGPMVPVGETRFGKAVAVAQGNPVGVGDAKFHFDGESAFVDTVYMGAFRRSFFERTGLFDESMIRNQDYEMNVRIRKAGGRIYLDPRIRSVYTPRGTWQGLWKQYFQYGWWRVETIRRHPDSARWRQLLPPGFAATIMGLALASPFLVIARGGFAAVTLAYLLVLLGVAYRERPRLPGTDWLLLPGALMTMHLSYGFGFLLSALSGGRFPYRAKRPAVPGLGKDSRPLTTAKSPRPA